MPAYPGILQRTLGLLNVSKGLSQSQQWNWGHSTPPSSASQVLKQQLARRCALPQVQGSSNLTNS